MNVLETDTREGGTKKAEAKRDKGRSTERK